MNGASMTRSALPCAVALASLALASTGCGNVDQDKPRRVAWIHAQTAKDKLYVREFLNSAAFDDYEFYDGWYPAENDPQTGNAWRWMQRRGIVRVRTTTGGAASPVDMDMRVFGWVPQEHVGYRKIVMEFSANGHVLDRFDPPKGSFEHSIIVPKSLLENSDWVDFTITVSNTARPAGDWRDLGFGTTGFHWTPVGGI
jgi:hypothetical protein